MSERLLTRTECAICLGLKPRSFTRHGARGPPPGKKLIAKISIFATSRDLDTYTNLIGDYHICWFSVKILNNYFFKGFELCLLNEMKTQKEFIVLWFGL